MTLSDIATPAPLQELVFEVHFESSEAISDALLWAGALSVAIEDANAETELEQPLFGEPGLEPKIPAWALNRVIASVASVDDIAPLLAAAQELAGEPLPDYALREVPALDWVRLTQSQFPPIEVSPRLWIVPSWHMATHLAQARAPDNSDTTGLITLALDPGLAFGTGSHPTTHLCLQWLDAQAGSLSGLEVLDYGCGSGILAIAAEKLGAARVLGIDIDPQAVLSSGDNATNNGCTRASFGLPDLALGQYDVVLANILTNPLKVLAPLLCGAVAAGGRLVLSGILQRQAAEVIAVYRAYLPDIAVWRAQDGWVCLQGSKAARA